MTDTDSVVWDDVDISEEIEWRKKISLNDNINLNDIFFEIFFPCITGNVKLINDCYSSKNSPYYSTVRNGKIKLHDLLMRKIQTGWSS